MLSLSDYLFALIDLTLYHQCTLIDGYSVTEPHTWHCTHKHSLLLALSHPWHKWHVLAGYFLWGKIEKCRLKIIEEFEKKKKITLSKFCRKNIFSFSLSSKWNLELNFEWNLSQVFVQLPTVQTRKTKTSARVNLSWSPQDLNKEPEIVTSTCLFATAHLSPHCPCALSLSLSIFHIKKT